MSAEQPSLSINLARYNENVTLGSIMLRCALSTERNYGIDAAFEDYETAGQYFHNTFGAEPAEKFTKTSEGIVKTGGVDPIVLLQYATCIARQAKSRKVKGYVNNIDPVGMSTDMSIALTNKRNREDGNDIVWSYARPKNLEAIAVRTSNLALEMIMGLKKAEELIVGASKLAASGVEDTKPRVVVELMENAKDIAQEAGLPDEVVEDLEIYPKKLTPVTSAGMTIAALNELEDINIPMLVAA